MSKDTASEATSPGSSAKTGENGGEDENGGGSEEDDDEEGIEESEAYKSGEKVVAEQDQEMEREVNGVEKNNEASNSAKDSSFPSVSGK